MLFFFLTLLTFIDISVFYIVMSIKFRKVTEFKKCNNKDIWGVPPVDESSNISLLFANQDELSSLSAN